MNSTVTGALGVHPDWSHRKPHTRIRLCLGNLRLQHHKTSGGHPSGCGRHPIECNTPCLQRSLGQRADNPSQRLGSNPLCLPIRLACEPHALSLLLTSLSLLMSLLPRPRPRTITVAVRDSLRAAVFCVALIRSSTSFAASSPGSCGTNAPRNALSNIAGPRRSTRRVTIWCFCS